MAIGCTAGKEEPGKESRERRAGEGEPGKKKRRAGQEEKEEPGKKKRRAGQEEKEEPGKESRERRAGKEEKKSAQAFSSRPGGCKSDDSGTRPGPQNRACSKVFFPDDPEYRCGVDHAAAVR